VRRIIRLGDSTSHGGKVVSATSHMTVGGLPVARLGDKCTCPKRGHNNCVIVEGDTNWTIDGIPVALEGHKLSCGGVLISSMPNSGRDEAGGGTASQGASLANLSSDGALASREAIASAQKQPEYDQHFLLINDQTGEPLEHARYRVTLSDGRSFNGVSNEAGLTEKVSADSALVADIEVFV
jgi:uncharacterized Zn-binding protein involved in type VI secretion